MTTFNLINEPWITVNLISGKHDVVSLRDIFHRASEIRSIECDNPLQTAAVTRLVLAVMYRAITPLFLTQKNHTKDADVKLWKMLWDDKNKALPVAMNEYFDKWGSRFDLFDAKRPFFQISGLQYSSTNESSIGEPKHYLGKIMPDGDLISVFRNSKVDVSISYAEAARVLISYQSWSTLAPLSPVVGIFPTDESAVPRLYPKGHRGWCSSIGVTMVIGRTLYETLLFNLVPNQLNEKDIPFWEERYPRKVPILFEQSEENEKPVLKKRNAKPVGQVQLFVWFAKSVKLVVKDGMVRSVIASENDSLNARSYNVYMARHHETQTAWRETESGEIAAYHFSGDSVWQNVPALIPRSRDGFIAPINVVWAAKVSNILQLKLPARIRIIGAKTDDRAQTFRGVIDKTVTITSLSKLDDPVVSALIEDTSAKMLKMVRSNYYGFSREVIIARYGEIREPQLESMMLAANNALDEAFVSLFRNATSSNSKVEVEKVLEALAKNIFDISKSISDSATPNELLGVWRSFEGETKIFSVALSRKKLIRALSNFYKNDSMVLENNGSLIRWAIKKNVRSLTSGTEIENYILNFWSKRKNLVSGKPSHIEEKVPYSFLSKLRNSSGSAFDTRITDLFNNNSKGELCDSLRRLSGVLISRGEQLDFGSLASMGTALLDINNRAIVAEMIIESQPEI